jgi:cellobiose phosphorylase
LSELVLAIEKLGLNEAEISTEVISLLDTLSDRVDYNSAYAKQAKLTAYFTSCFHTVSGRKTKVPLKELARDLDYKANWLIKHLRSEEWLINSEGYGWFNGYYDNKGMRVEGDFPKGVRMTLAGQVFALMGGVANNDQAVEIVRSVDRYLYDIRVGGYRLNTDFGEVLPDLGRAFGFAFGHKENGSMFSHMAVMYAYALYQRGMARQGYKVLAGIYQHCQDFAHSHIYPGIPEYINARGRGMYPYLTGSASWYMLTLVIGGFGVKGILGDLMLDPKLVPEQFDSENKVRLDIFFAGRKLAILYHNQEKLDYGDYRISSVSLNNELIELTSLPVILPRSLITSLNPRELHIIEIELRTNKEEL